MKRKEAMSKEKEPNMEKYLTPEAEHGKQGDSVTQGPELPKQSYSEELIKGEDGLWYHHTCYYTEACEGCGPLPEYKEY